MMINLKLVISDRWLYFSALDRLLKLTYIIKDKILLKLVISGQWLDLFPLAIV
jgi:hypothetical protein